MYICPLPPTSHPSPYLLVVTEPQFEFPESYSKWNQMWLWLCVIFEREKTLPVLKFFWNMTWLLLRYSRYLQVRSSGDHNGSFWAFRACCFFAEGSEGLLLAEKKKMHNLKTENYVLLSRQNWGLEPRMQPLRQLLRDCSDEIKEEPGYIGVLQQRPGSQNIKISLLVKENQVSQLRNLALLYYVYGKMQKSGLSEIIPLICTLAT